MDRSAFENELLMLVNDRRKDASQQLIGLVALLRPAVASDFEFAKQRFRWLVGLLNDDSLLSEWVAGSVLDALKGYSPDKLFAESGIISIRSFWHDLLAKFNRKFIPEYYPANDARTLLHRVFVRRTDYLWLSSIPFADWHRFLEALRRTDAHLNRSSILGAISDSLIVLAQRITAVAYEPEIDSKLPELESMNSPFLELARTTNKLVKVLPNAEAAGEVACYAETIFRLIDRCRGLIDQIYANKDRYGVSMHFIYLIKRFEQQVLRYSMLFRAVCSPNSRKRDEAVLRLLVQLLKGEKQRNSIRKHLHTSSRLLLYKIAASTSKAGEHYKCASAKEYFVMLRAALGGGLVVGLLACFKLAISYMPLSQLGTAVGYSLNYALGFVAIYMLHFTLATKQPAMTASTIAKTLANSGSKSMVTASTLKLIRQIFRSQFVSLVGNVAAALPFAYLLTLAFSYVSSSHIATTAKSVALMGDISPYTSLSLLYAAIAGVYLMLSGLIAGYYDNLILHNNLYLRLRHHEGLRRLLGQHRLNRFALYISNNIGNIAGNVALGIFLGATSTIGHFIGVPLDIRHVTFSAANFGIALADFSGTIPLSLILEVAVGILGIGLMNVVVSFGLSIAVALYSHGANPSDYLRLIRVLAIDFIKMPHHYILPLRNSDKPKR